MAKLLVLGLGQISGTYAAPLLSLLPFKILAEEEGEEPPMSPDKPTLWIYLAVAVALVLLGGAFAGLTIALMGQVSSCSVLFFREELGAEMGDVCWLMCCVGEFRMRFICRSLRSPGRGARRAMLQGC